MSRGLGPGIGAVAFLQIDVLSHGGLAMVAVGVLIACFVGIPLASIEWRTGVVAEDAPVLQRVSRAVGDLWSLLAVAALAAPTVGALGGRGVAAAMVGWVAAAAVMAGGGTAVLMILTSMAMLLFAVDGGTALAASAPWDLLGPQWQSWSGWLPRSAALAILISGAGLGHWAAGPRAVPGRRRLPWAALGLAVVAVVSVAISRAAAWEVPATDANAGALLTITGASVAITAVLARTARGPHPVLHPIIGLTATLWLAGPGAESLPLFWYSLFPVAPAVAGLALVAHSSGGERWLGGLAAAVFAGIAVLGWPGLPTSPLAAAAAAMVPVAAIWYVGTRVSLARPVRATT